MSQDLQFQGFAIFRGFCSEEHLAELAELYSKISDKPGQRFLGNCLEMEGLSFICRLDSLAELALGEQSVRVRAILFQKSAAHNWLVPWHQDVTLAAPYKCEVKDAARWSQKDGIWHVQPSDEVLDRMIALRLHLDPCGPDDGALRVVPGSHRKGRLRDGDVEACARAGFETITVNTGDVLAMRPLLVHSSPKGTGASRRRVLHLEYCARSAYPFSESPLV